jgi:hypothetical protein
LSTSLCFGFGSISAAKCLDPNYAAVIVSGSLRSQEAIAIELGESLEN